MSPAAFVAFPSVRFAGENGSRFSFFAFPHELPSKLRSIAVTSCIEFDSLSFCTGAQAQSQTAFGEE
jgi:hypothetical protein